MSIDDRFDDLAASLAGFYRAWAVYVGLDLGLFRRIRAAAPSGLTPAGLAAQAGWQAEAVDTWVRLAEAVDVVEFDGERASMDELVAAILLDDQRPEYLGGQFVSTVVSSLDYEGLIEFARSGRPIDGRPARYHRAIETLTAQDIAVFFQEGLALSSRISIEPRPADDLLWPAQFDLVYFQDTLHDQPDPVATLRSGWACVRPGGRLIVLDWCLPESIDESRSLHGAMMWGIQLDQLFQGTRLWDHVGFANLFQLAGIGEPGIIDLPSGATLFVAQRS